MQRRIVNAVKGFSIYEHLHTDLMQTTPLDRWRRLTEAVTFIRSLGRDMDVVAACERRKAQHCSVRSLRRKLLRAV